MFEPEPNLIFWTIISFGILILVLYKVALPPLLGLLEERRRLIAQSLLDAEETRKRNEEALQMYKEKLGEASRKADEIIATTKKEASALKEKIVEQAKKDSSLIVQHANEEIEHQKNKALQEIKDKTAGLILSATAKVLKKELTPQEQARLIEEDLKELEN
jgi:F-type H+-transporting ATPase subunit b